VTAIREQRFDLPPLQRAFEATAFALEQALARQAELDKELEAVADTAPYREPVGWLRCFRGIDTLSAVILLAEVVDFQRFRRRRELMAYLGLVPSEYSSGESQRRGALTKAATVTRAGFSSRPPGTIAIGPPSAAHSRAAARGNRRRS
jgi:transposase